ncbi:MAG: protein involved in polysaccharide export with SLBB domain [Planctomycetota bacterium]|jgi:protein involved in polysaccharide export with SLBB domain
MLSWGTRPRFERTSNRSQGSIPSSLPTPAKLPALPQQPGMNFRLVLPLIALLGACSTPQGKPMNELAGEINATRYSGQDPLGPGDEISVRFSLIQDWDQTVVVQGDGLASFRELDEIGVGGLLPGQLDELLTKAYSRILSGTPKLSVVVTLQAPKQAFVVGEVAAPGPVPLTPGQELTFLQAMALVGGPNNESSWLGNTHLVRWDPESQTQQTWVLDARTRWWGSTEAILLQPNDVLYIPNTRVDRAGIQLDMWLRRMIPFPRIFVQ